MNIGSRSSSIRFLIFVASKAAFYFPGAGTLRKAYVVKITTSENTTSCGVFY